MSHAPKFHRLAVDDLRWETSDAVSMTFATGTSVCTMSQLNWQRTAPRSCWFMNRILPIRARRQKNLTFKSRVIPMVGKLSFPFMVRQFYRLRAENTRAAFIELETCFNIPTVE